MSEYIVRRANAPLPELTGRVFDPDTSEFFQVLNRAEIALYPWDESGYRPEARACVAFAEGGLSVLLAAREKTVQARETRCGGPVCVDSCLEFFLAPFPESDENYLNIEVNPLGTVHLGLGAGRAPRRVWACLPEGFDLQVSRHEGGWWAARYRLPGAFFREVFGLAPASGGVMRGNFYKCDESVHPHFGTWSPVRAPRPDFHRPECFGRIRIE